MKQALAVVFLALVLVWPLNAQDTGSRKIRSLEGPATATLGGVAEIQIPQGYSFIDGKTLKPLLEAVGQSAEGIVGSLSPTNADWSVMFYYEASGYIKDEEKDKLNADKLLKDYREGTEEGNKRRAEVGAPPIHVTGWELPPRYNTETHNLEWALRGTCEGEEILNYDTRLLGRKGYMSVKLIVAPNEYAASFPAFTNLMASYKFKNGETYAEYKPGDKIAKYGLGALVLGGAAVGAAKLGLFVWLGVLFKKAGKLVIVAIVAVAALFKRIFAKIFNRNRDN